MTRQTIGLFSGGFLFILMLMLPTPEGMEPAAMAVAGQTHPYLLMIPGTIACSCAFMLPSGTGTNAVIFGSERISIPQMAACGFWLNFISIAVVTLVMYLIAVPLFGITQGLPAWAM